MVCPRGTQPWREAETQRTTVPMVLAVNIPALLGQERGEGAADVLGVGQGQGARWAGGMGSSQEMLGACLSCWKGGIEAREGGHGAWLWRGWQAKPVLVMVMRSHVREAGGSALPRRLRAQGRILGLILTRGQGKVVSWDMTRRWRFEELARVSVCKDGPRTGATS